MQSYIDRCTPTWQPLEDNIQRFYTGFYVSAMGLQSSIPTLLD